VGSALDLGEHRRDLRGALLRLFGELADFVGDDGKAAALLARPGRLDGGVEREEVRLLGNRADRVDDAGDLLGAAGEIADGRRHRAGRLADRPHGGRRLLGGLGPVERDLANGSGGGGGLLGLGNRLLHVSGDLLATAQHAVDDVDLALGSGGHLGDRRADLVDRPTGLLRRGAHRDRGAVDLGRRPLDAAEQAAELVAGALVRGDRSTGLLDDRVDRATGLADLVAGAVAERLGGGGDGAGQVSRRERLEAGLQIGEVTLLDAAQPRGQGPHGRGDGASDEDRQGDREQQRHDADEDERPLAGARVGARRGDVVARVGGNGGLETIGGRAQLTFQEGYERLGVERARAVALVDVVDRLLARDGDRAAEQLGEARAHAVEVGERGLRARAAQLRPELLDRSLDLRAVGVHLPGDAI